MYMAQLQDARIGQDVEQQFGMMSRTIMNLESDALEAQSLLEDKDRAIERLMHQLDHQRDLFIKLDEQQQKTIAISQSQQKNMDALIETHDAKTVAKLSSFLNTVQHRLQAVLQQQQGSSGRGRQEREGTGQTWSSETTVGCQVSKREASKPLVREDSVSSEPSDAYTAGTTAVSETLAGSKPSISPSSVLGDGSAHFSIDSICSTLDALENRVSESQQKMTVLTGEIGLLRRQSVALSESRNNSIRIKNFSVSRGQAAEDTVRAALEKSLKDALLAKQMAQQELENERQRWQEDQSHRIKALEESLVAVEDMDKGVDANCNGDEAVQELRRQLREAIDEIDILNQQHQSNLKDMRQLFDIVPDPRRKSHMQLYSSHQQLQQQKITGTPGDKTALSESTSSLVPAGVIGFSMEALIGRVKELVARSEQIEQDNLELREQLGKMGEQSRRNSNQEILTKKQHTPEDTDLLDSSLKQRGQSTRVLKSDLERLHASAEMVELLEKELELLKQHTDVLMDENARLAELAAAGATGTPVNSRSSLFGRVVHKPHQSDELDELQEIIRAKDKLLRERDQVVQEQEKALLQMQADMAKIKEGNAVDCALNSNSAVKLSPFDVNTLEELRAKCGKLEGEMGELRMIIAALESVSGGPGTGSQLLDSLSVTSSAQSPPSSFWFSSGLARSFNFGSLPQKHPEESPSSAMSPVPSASDVFGAGQQGLDSSANALSPTSNNTAIAGATAALRKEFRRAMGELREEKDKAVRKEVEERRRLERELRELRRELQTIQTSTHA
ncbi:hypothetical protein BC939DRAFT_39578 [Gamsiella multidivaricata]|uniref:uncharacterized protein n=1 Tax=Gamsiella multidivaricata TaxID=101098 RepID=UPI0022211AE5|nr:uncharacterized protein BC939DRAFT_39578 [Gamsiella multidivaricata]KAI7828980.1 hypothetical protein BC939DRAFT_39578 [Gamsiella multidivaricata]